MSTRLTHRIPSRPSAQHSPSPDKGTKSHIVSTTPPKIKKEMIIEKREKEREIERIKEENKRLKEEMREALGRRERGEEEQKGDHIKEEKLVKEKEKEKERQDLGRSKGTIKKNQYHPKQPLSHQRTVQKLPSRHQTTHSTFDVTFSSVNQTPSPPIMLSQTQITDIKSQLLTIISQKQLSTKQQMQQLETRIYKLEEYQYKIIQKLEQLHRRSRSHIKKSSLSQTVSPSLHRSNSKDLVKHLQSQLKSAQSTILQLSQSLRTEQVNKQSIKLQTKLERDRKEIIMKEMKLQNEGLVKELKVAYQQASEGRELRAYYEKEIGILKKRVKEFEISRQQNILKRQSLGVKQESEEIKSLKREIQKYKYEQHQRVEIERTKVKEREEERRRTGKKELEEFEKRMEETGEVLKVLQEEVERGKEEKRGLLEEVERLRRENGEVKYIMDGVRLMEGELREKIKNQQKEILALQKQLQQAQFTISTLKEQHLNEISSYQQQLHSIKSLLQTIITNKILPIQTHTNTISFQTQKHQHQTLISQLSKQYKQQILTLETNIHNLELSIEKRRASQKYLQEQNEILRRQVKQIRGVIERWEKGEEGREFEEMDVGVVDGDGEEEGSIELRMERRGLGETVKRIKEVIKKVKREFVEIE